MHVCYGPGWRKRGIATSRPTSSSSSVPAAARGSSQTLAAVLTVVAADAAAAPAAPPAATLLAAAVAPADSPTTINDASGLVGRGSAATGEPDAALAATAEAVARPAAREGNRPIVRFQDGPTPQPNRCRLDIGPLM